MILKFICPHPDNRIGKWEDKVLITLHLFSEELPHIFRKPKLKT